MRANAKYQKIAGVIEQRIRRGDYVLSGLQSDRTIAAEFGVARLTARQAVRLLIEQGHILRKPNGRLALPGEEGMPATTMQIAFLAPSFNSPYLQRMRVAAERVATALGYRFRPIDYVHWTDQVVNETLTLFDGVICTGLSGMTEDELAGRRQRSGSGGAGLLSLGTDLAQHGYPSLLVDQPSGVHLLCDHLASLGHRQVDCLNIAARDPGSDQRIQQWQVWKAVHDAAGELHDVRLEAFGDPLRKGYDAMRHLLAERRLTATAVLCMSELATVGACRALYEAGLTPGREMSICTFGGDGTCRFHAPSISCLEHGDPTPYLRIWCEWIGRGCKGWIGPLQMKLDEHLFHGESTAPPGGWPDVQRRMRGPDSG